MAVELTQEDLEFLIDLEYDELRDSSVIGNDQDSGKPGPADPANTYLSGDTDGADILTNIAELQFSDQSIVAPMVNPGEIRMERDASDDGTLTAHVHLLFDADGISQIKYQWESSPDGKKWTPISGATQERYSPRQSDTGLSLRLALTYIFIDSAYSAVTDHSAPTPAVQAPTDEGKFNPNDSQRGAIVSGSDGDNTEKGAEGKDQAEEKAAAGHDVNSDEDPTSEIPPDTDVAYGNGGNQALFGVSADDIVMSNVGQVSLNGTPNGHIIYGTEGNDVLIGGKGDDIIYGGGGDDQILGGEGDDLLLGEDGSDYIAGGEGDDTLSGGAGDDILDGGAGDDTLDGGSNNDVLMGGDGADSVMGGSGDDIIEGGLGDDILYGGVGHDLFIYHLGDGSDSIMDFEIDYDELKIDDDDKSDHVDANGSEIAADSDGTTSSSSETNGSSYTVTETDYGWDYTLRDGSVIKVHSNRGKGSDGDDSDSDNSGSGNSGSGSSNSGSGSGSSGSGNGAAIYAADDEFDYANFGNPSDLSDDEWTDMVAFGVLDMPVDDPAIVDVGEYTSLTDWADDPGLPDLLGFSTIAVGSEDYHLIA